jgi:hypothetical protein
LHEKKAIFLITTRITIILVALLSLLFAGYYLYLDRLWASRSSQVDACCSTLINIGTSLEMYSTDNGGHYPHTLTTIAPGYMRSIPTCPSAGQNEGYIKSYERAESPDTFTIYCKGHFHDPQAPADYPLFSSTAALSIKPETARWTSYERWGYKHEPEWLWKIMHK